MKPIQVGLLGIGTVGSGTFKVLQRNQEEIRRRAGRGIQVTIATRRNLELTETLRGEPAPVRGDPPSDAEDGHGGD